MEQSGLEQAQQAQAGDLLQGPRKEERLHEKIKNGTRWCLNTKRAPNQRCTGGAPMAAKETTTHAVLPQVVRGADLDRRAVLYARVSTTNHGQDPEVQSREIREYCQRRGWPLVGEYVDAGISGAKERRPQLDRLVADAHKRKFEVVVVWKFDRFARSVSHLLRALENSAPSASNLYRSPN
jgi:hypothetical protein